MKIESGMFIGMVFTAIMVPLLSYLLYRGKLKKEMGWAILVLSALLGFAYFAPMFPWQLQMLMLDKLPQTNLPVIVVAIGTIVVSSLLLGRVFCGYVCPIGAVQELAYLAPLKKIKVSSKITSIVRWMAFAVLLISSIALSVNIMKMIGVQDLFTLTLSYSMVIFVVIIVASTVIYRPFCRLLCPIGALSSVLSGRSIYGVRRTDGCVECGRCEKVCPSQVLKGRAGAECYLCGRCTGTCHKDALRYTRSEMKK